MEKVLSYFEIARAGRRAHRGRRRAADGPSRLLCRAHPVHRRHTRMRIAQEEIFGPVLTAIPFEDEAEALAIANDVRYGLTGYIWTSDVGRALRCRRCAGGRHGLGQLRERPPPAGAVRRHEGCGIGRDGGDYSFDFYMETKNICLAKGTHGCRSSAAEPRGTAMQIIDHEGQAME